VAELGGLQLSMPFVLEVQVHTALRDILRLEPVGIAGQSWPHHLSMARLVARAVRLGKPALIQTGVPAEQAAYRSSYLIPALLWSQPVAIVAEQWVLDQISAEIPALQISLGLKNPEHFLLLLTPEIWLTKELTMPVIIDGADRLENWVQEWLQVDIKPTDWDLLTDSINHRAQLTKSIFQRPVNPYECYLLDIDELEVLGDLLANRPAFTQVQQQLPAIWQRFQQQLDQGWIWARVDRAQGALSLFTRPIDLGVALADIWARQPCVLIGNVLDSEITAPTYRQELGLGEMTCVRFGIGINLDPIQLYVPNWMPMPNTAMFQTAFVRVSIELIHRQLQAAPGFIAIVVGDTPLRAQAAAQIAAQYGSRVKVEKLGLGESNILVTGWDFWCARQEQLPAPKLLIIATLPIPSVEDPLVAAKVIVYKQQRQDWFRQYLLPVGMKVLRRSISTVARSAGLVAILDNRTNHRSYGTQIIATLGAVGKVDRPEFR
jgi:ATP-dependent DNA helicase DinG